MKYNSSVRSYTITQVAEQLGIKVHTIRYWEKHVPLLSVERDIYGKRLYNRQDIYVIMRLRYYIEKRRFTLKGAAEELIKEMSRANENTQRTESLHVLKQLEMQKERLLEAKKIIEESKDVSDTT